MGIRGDCGIHVAAFPAAIVSVLISLGITDIEQFALGGQKHKVLEETLAILCGQLTSCKSYWIVVLGERLAARLCAGLHMPFHFTSALLLDPQLMSCNIMVLHGPTLLPYWCSSSLSMGKERSSA